MRSLRRLVKERGDEGLPKVVVPADVEEKMNLKLEIKLLRFRVSLKREHL